MKQLFAIVIVLGTLGGCAGSGRTSLPQEPSSSGGSTGGDPDLRKADSPLSTTSCTPYRIKGDAPCRP